MTSEASPAASQQAPFLPPPCTQFWLQYCGSLLCTNAVRAPYFQPLVLLHGAGMGMFTEAYFIFSVGNLKGIWKAAYPDCWATHETCSSSE